MNPQEKPNILEYQDVVKRPNPMVNINPLARGSGKVVTLEDRLTKLKKAKLWQKQMQLWRNRDHKFDMARMPRVEMVHLGDILIDEDIQRQLDEKHCANKICNINLFDPALLQTLQCIKRNDGQFVSIDGQHTGSVIAGLIDEGFIKGECGASFLNDVFIIKSSALISASFSNVKFLKTSILLLRLSISLRINSSCVFS